MYPNKEDLITYCENAFLNKNWEKHDITGDGIPETFCNQAVDYIISTYTGYIGFKQKYANQIVDIMKTDKVFQKVEMKDVPKVTDLGYIVIAGQQANGHGHVCVCMPGTIYSGSWKQLVPLCVNIGNTNFINKGVSRALKTIPEFFVYNPLETPK